MYCPIKAASRMIYVIDAIAVFDTIAYIRSIVAIVLIPVPEFYH